MRPPEFDHPAGVSKPRKEAQLTLQVSQRGLNLIVLVVVSTGSMSPVPKVLSFDHSFRSFIIVGAAAHYGDVHALFLPPSEVGFAETSTF